MKNQSIDRIQCKSICEIESNYENIHALLYFPSPYFKIIVGFPNKPLSVYGTGDNLGKLEKTIDLKTDRFDINDIIQWNEHEFIVATSGHPHLSGITSISMKNYEEVKSFKNEKGMICELLKINDDELLFAQHVETLAILSYKRNEIIKKYEGFGCYTDCTRLIPSFNTPNCIFINNATTITDGYSLRFYIWMVDLRDGKNVFEITKKGHDPKTDIYTLTNILNPKKEENLIYGNYDGYLFFYNLGTSPRQHKEPPPVLTHKVQLKFNNRISPKIRLLTAIRNRYLFAVGTREDVYVLDIHSLLKNKKNDGDEVNIVKNVGIRKKEGNNWNHVRDFTNIIISDTKVQLIVNIGKENVSFLNILEFSGLELSDKNSKFVKEDEENRVGFLRNEIEIFVFNEDCRNKIFVNFNLKNKIVRNIFRILL